MSKKDQVMEHVRVTASGCWEWLRGKAKRGGYGQLRHNGRVMKAHRVAFEIWHGSIPNGLFVCHRCDNPPCCNPAHLFAGTPKENAVDAWQKGRLPLPANAPIGESHHSAKLTADDVIAIRRSESGAVDLASRFGVSRQMIHRIRKGLAWRTIQ